MTNHEFSEIIFQEVLNIKNMKFKIEENKLYQRRLFAQDQIFCLVIL